MATWRELLINEMESFSESLDNVISSTMTDSDLDRKFHAGYGGSEGCAFTVWTANRVYFPAVYDGAEWVASVARNPDGKPTYHVGGE